MDVLIFDTVDWKKDIRPLRTCLCYLKCCFPSRTWSNIRKDGQSNTNWK